MARIQPSFLHFYLFQTQQHNTSFLLTSKDELKYPGGLSEATLPLSFTIVNGVLYSFIPFSQPHFPLKNNLKPSPQISLYIQDCQDFAQILPISYPILNFKPHSRGTFTTQSLATNQSVFRGIHKISSTTRFSTPL